MLLVFRVYAFHLQNKKILWVFIVPAGVMGAFAYVSSTTLQDRDISLTNISKLSFRGSWKELHSTSNVVITRGCVTPVYGAKQCVSSLSYCHKLSHVSI